MEKNEVKQAIMEAIDAYGEACKWRENKMCDIVDNDNNFQDFLEENPEVQEAINKAFLKIIDDYNTYRFGFFAVTAWQGGKCAEELEKQGKNLFNYGGIGGGNA